MLLAGGLTALHPIPIPASPLEASLDLFSPLEAESQPHMLQWVIGLK